MTTYPNPGAIANVPPSPNKVESTWGNAIRDRVVNHFDNATDRDAAITSPVAGMTCYVDGVGLLVYAGSTDGWRPPWNLPWGNIAHAEMTVRTDSVADITGGSVTFTAVTNRLYKVSFCVPLYGPLDSGMTVTLLDGSNTLLTTWYFTDPTSSGTFEGSGFWIEAITAGSVTRKLHLPVGSSGCRADSTPGWLLVEDIGPNGNPS